MTKSRSIWACRRLPADELQHMIDELESEMKKAAQALEFEKGRCPARSDF